MNSLLIYNDSITSSTFISDFKANLGEAFSFRITTATLNKEDFSFDKVASDFLLNVLPQKIYDVIFLPYNLSDENYLELAGLQIAYHIRLTLEFNNKYTPIVFYGNETPYQINKITKAGEILFTSNVYSTQKHSIDSFKEVADKILTQGNIFDFEKYFLSKISIKPSGNYSSHHSIANEWSILRWANFLKIESDKINEIRNSIGSSLYFKYLKARFPSKKSDSDNSALKLKNKGKVLFIDDELNKGWEVIFNEITKDIPNDCKYFVGNEFKGKSAIEIENTALESVKKFDADLVILDLRLHDDDFKEKVKLTEITGYKILEKIKKHNNGIQVIIFSATNKIWNLQALQNAGADGFIIKESPENSVDESFTNQSITNIYTAIDTCFEMSFLKDVFYKTRLIKNTFLEVKKDDIGEFKNIKLLIKQKLETAFFLSKSNKTIDFALFEYIQILEAYCNYYTFLDKKNNKAIVYHNNNKVINNRSNEHIIYEIKNDKIISEFEYEKDYYHFQKSFKENDKQYVNYKKNQTEYANDKGFFSFSLKLVAVLCAHLGDTNNLKSIMELIFIRNNKIAHSGNFDHTKRIILNSDIKVTFEVIRQLITKTF